MPISSFFLSLCSQCVLLFRAAGTRSDDPNALPEDRFHLKLPSNVDAYTGIPYETNSNHSVDIDAEGELPEDR